MNSRNSHEKYDFYGQYWSTNIPIFIPSFNAVTYLKMMIEQLADLGCKNITVIDNASTYKPMLEYLDRVAKMVTVVRLKENLGPRNLIYNPFNFSIFPRFFCVTDPDLVFNDQMPRNFVAELLNISMELESGKVGLALDITKRDKMVQEDIMVGKSLKIWEHEAKHWEQKIFNLPEGQPVFKAEIDTTFALYNKDFFDPYDEGQFSLRKFLSALRVGGNFTCQHLPWYKENGLPAEEENYYRRAAKDSFYLKADENQKTRYE